jgi:16S rRNA processing protein RimM
MDRPAVVPVGTVGRAHGVRGWVRVRSDMDPPEDLLRHDTWLVERAGGWRPVAVRAARTHGNAFVAHLEGIEDRDAAAELAGTQVGLPRDALPALDDGQYYWVDLIGLEVVDESGESLGVLREMIETGANDVMVIRPRASSDRDRGRGADRIVPFLTGDVVRDVDLAAGRIQVSWPIEDTEA